MLDFDFLYRAVEHADERVGELLAGAPLGVALAAALLLGLRHATDPDHLVAVTSLVAVDGGRTSAATRLGAWWGAGHACTLLAVGAPLLLAKGRLPSWLETGAERAVGVVIVLLALRVLVTWVRGDHAPERRTGRRAFAIGVLHGVAGTGAVVLLLVTALPGTAEAAAALAIFAPASVVSMVLATTGFAWLLSRPALEPVYQGVVIPALGASSALFGVWYLGLG